MKSPLTLTWQAWPILILPGTFGNIRDLTAYSNSTLTSLESLMSIAVRAGTTYDTHLAVNARGVVIGSKRVRDIVRDFSQPWKGETKHR